MKKALALLLALLMVVSLVACGQPAVQESKAPEATPSAEPTPEPTPGPTPEPTPEPSEEPVPEVTVPPMGAPGSFTVEDLMGKWSLYAWDLTVGGMYTEEVDDFYVFTDSTLTYIDNNNEAGVWNFTFTGENTMTLVGGTTTNWELNVGENGELIVIDPAAFLVYYCTKVEEEPVVEPSEEPTAEPTVEPTAEPSEEPVVEPTPEPTEAPVVSPLASDILGTWNCSSCDIAGVNYPLTGALFIFTDTHYEYTQDGARATYYTYAWTDEDTISLVDASGTGAAPAVWEMKFENGMLVCVDEANGITYYCEVPGAEEPAPTEEPAPSEEPSAPALAADILGTWTCTSCDMYGSNWPLTNALFIFTDTHYEYTQDGVRTTYYTYTWTDEDTISLVDASGTGSAPAVWDLEIVDGVLVCTDSANGIVYYCEKL